MYFLSVCTYLCKQQDIHDDEEEELNCHVYSNTSSAAAAAAADAPLHYHHFERIFKRHEKVYKSAFLLMHYYVVCKKGFCSFTLLQSVESAAAIASPLFIPHATLCMLSRYVSTHTCSQPSKRLAGWLHVYLR